jgi:enamine deaminase RidA (YjgF/YER057c/UK114 family)
MSLIRKIPTTVAAPMPGAFYAHSVEVPPGARWVYVSGQLGARPDGSVPDSFDEQIEWCWKNIVAVLAESGMGIEDLVKVTTFLTDRSQREKNAEVRGRYLGETRPAQTLLFISGLTQPEYLVEVEAIAAKAP